MVFEQTSENITSAFLKRKVTLDLVLDHQNILSAFLFKPIHSISGNNIRSSCKVIVITSLNGNLPTARKFSLLLRQHRRKKRAVLYIDREIYLFARTTNNMLAYQVLYVCTCVWCNQDSAKIQVQLLLRKRPLVIGLLTFLKEREPLNIDLDFSFRLCDLTKIV